MRGPCAAAAPEHSPSSTRGSGAARDGVEQAYECPRDRYGRVVAHGMLRGSVVIARVVPRRPAGAVTGGAPRAWSIGVAPGNVEGHGEGRRRGEMAAGRGYVQWPDGSRSSQARAFRIARRSPLIRARPRLRSEPSSELTLSSGPRALPYWPRARRPSVGCCYRCSFIAIYNFIL